MYGLHHAFKFICLLRNVTIVIHMGLVSVKCMLLFLSHFESIVMDSALQISVRNLKVVGSEVWNLMREGEAEKQVICFSHIGPSFGSSFLYFYILPLK